MAYCEIKMKQVLVMVYKKNKKKSKSNGTFNCFFFFFNLLQAGGKFSLERLVPLNF